MSSKPEVTVKEWELIRRIFTAFRGVTLEDGVGLKQAEGMDNYGSPEQLAKLRHQDETENWERLSTDTLNECSSALSFFDAGGHAVSSASVFDCSPYRRTGNRTDDSFDRST